MQQKKNKHKGQNHSTAPGNLQTRKERFKRSTNICNKMAFTVIVGFVIVVFTGISAPSAFAEMNLHRIYLRVDISNTRGIHCYSNCGLVEEGRLRDAVYHRGHFEDQLVMSVLRSEYLE